METNPTEDRTGVLLDARLVTLDGAGGYTVIEDGALAWREGRIDYAGARDAMPATFLQRVRLSAEGALVTPALIDCHTHLVFAGNRATEFEMRLQGATYEEIARAGGGIVSTVRATRAASEEALLAASLPRARALLAEGVTCIEIKSGYGLDFETERRMLRVARRLGEELGVAVRTTFLGLHALPPESSADRAGYVSAVCDDWLPRLAAEGLVDAVDAFCEGIGFTPDEVRRCFEAARHLGLPVKLHAEQLSDLDGAALASGFGALSADHLEWLSERGVAAMARSGTAAVLLPGAFYALRETRQPPIDALREAGVALAVASDLNPGTSPMPSLRLAMNQACVLFRLTPEEALRGVTTHAAQALGLAGERGALKAGFVADFLLWPCAHPAELAYWIGSHPRPRVFVAGQARNDG
ncbi:imidazolonepropionase [Pseudofulvimonas gallinarii]|uniref:Imidazolonepropionase n=1 Tax=Pseudofulvimonas gallinarii TaxID=634155 RepID=A0A4S3L064_9GAMM|nr:imidazolonepropionase [Pseudofulvimonas gallinarii]TCT01189.1 imidazolonepropionase [Pseudofulvimonas gallinarii]THD14956.1 imidazolonepropionase [Pseudofulvimonas gallinarii]